MVESIHHAPQELAEQISANADVPYRRAILGVKWVSPDSLPVLFHTSPTDGMGSVNPAYCQSYDYRLGDRVIPVTYALPTPHVNRVRVASEIYGRRRLEGLDMKGVPHTYLTFRRGAHGGVEYE